MGKQFKANAAQLAFIAVLPIAFLFPVFAKGMPKDLFAVLLPMLVVLFFCTATFSAIGYFGI
ncbi:MULTISPECIES: hypothetical protein [unclassified Acinetobacter]|uniref:hypothetical protein n=1 Tax=unclassified Acinetobacter TaxID=196816 RepID=UPI0035B9B926